MLLPSPPPGPLTFSNVNKLFSYTIMYFSELVRNILQPCMFVLSNLNKKHPKVNPVKRSLFNSRTFARTLEHRDSNVKVNKRKSINMMAKNILFYILSIKCFFSALEKINSTIFNIIFFFSNYLVDIRYFGQSRTSLFVPTTVYPKGSACMVYS